MHRRVLTSMLAVASVCVASCHSPPAHDTPPPQETTAPGAQGTVYRIDPTASNVRVLVYRDGALARLGHNHVISSAQIAGTVTLATPIESSSFSLSVPADSWVVDDPQWRLAEGADFAGEVKAKDRDGTRANMLGANLLNAVEHPIMRIDAIRMPQAPPDAIALARVQLAGRSKDIAFAAEVEHTPTRVRFRGATTLTHEQLGLRPFSVMLGALRVREDIVIKYDLVARRP